MTDSFLMRFFKNHIAESNELSLTAASPRLL